MKPKIGDLVHYEKAIWEITGVGPRFLLNLTRFGERSARKFHVPLSFVRLLTEMEALAYASE